MAVLGTLNIDKKRTDHGYFGGYAWYLKEAMVASGRFTVTGSGDGKSRFAYSGVTSALSPEQQGSGGDYDCWMLPRLEAHTVLLDGYAQARSWIVLNEVGSNRQYMFCATDQLSAGWSVYGRMAYNPGGGATPAWDASSADYDTIPAAATNEQWLNSSSRGTGSGADMLNMYNSFGRVHVFCHDEAVNGVTGFGILGVRSDRQAGGFFVCPVSDGPEWDTDPLLVVTGSNFNSISGYGQFATANQSWMSWTLHTRNLYNGGGASRTTTGTARVQPLMAYGGSSPNKYIKGWLHGVAGCSARMIYPSVIQGASGRRWVGTSANNYFMIEIPVEDPIQMPL